MSWFVRIEKRPGHVVAYGPFASEDQAIRRNMFSRSTDEYDEAAAGRYLGRYPFRVFLRARIERYTNEEIQALQEEPEGFGYKTYKFKPASALKDHPSWKSFDKEYFWKMVARDLS